MSKAEEAKELFQQGANCAQAACGAFAPECGLSQEDAFRLSSGFGGGFGRMREVCGAVSGMMLVLNMKFGNTSITDKDAKDGHYALVQKYIRMFQEETGSIVCRELLGLPGKQSDPPVSEARTNAYYKKRPCAEMVALAAQITETALKENL